MGIESRAYWFLLTASFLATAVWESFRPKRPLSASVERRWSGHAAVMMLSAVISIGLIRVSPVVMAVLVKDSRFGLLNRSWIPFLVRCLVTVLLMDFVKYFAHRACHSVYYLWRVHQVHHSDPDFEVSTAFRSHPIEVMFMHGVNLAAIALFAPPAAAVLIAELASCLQSVFGHANASLPGSVEKPLRAVFVTPDMHRIHHSVEVPEQSSNFGDIFPWWDRLFRSYLAEPAAGQDAMEIGLKGVPAERCLNVGFLLMLPFRPDPRESGSPEPVLDRTTGVL